MQKEARQYAHEDCGAAAEDVFYKYRIDIHRQGIYLDLLFFGGVDKLVYGLMVRVGQGTGFFGEEIIYYKVSGGLGSCNDEYSIL